jgi:riboflavin synthase
MFTGIIQAVATIENVTDLDGIRTFTIGFPAGFCQGH